MKKLTTLLISALALGITVSSCTKDSPKTPEASIEGKWTFSTVQALDAGDQPTGSTQICAGLDGGVDLLCSEVKYDVVTFNVGKGAVYTNYPEKGCDPTDVPLTYTKKGTTLTMNFQTPVVTEIMSLTSAILKLKIIEGGKPLQITLTKG